MMAHAGDKYMEFEKELKTAMQEEEKDSNHYGELAAMADKAYPDKGYGSILRDIAEEEKMHRRHLQAIIDDMKKTEN